MATLVEFKCPGCGGALSFDSDTQMMKCPYCDAELDVKAVQAIAEEATQEDDMEWASLTGTPWEEEEEKDLVNYFCNSCAGEIVTEVTTAATSCPYCGNPVVMSDNVSGSLRPDCVIPFQLDKADVLAALKKHLSGKLLLPKAFKTDNHIQEVKGVYVPFWLFDAHANGQARYRTTRVRTWSTSRYIYTETRHYSVYRAGEMDFEAVPVDGSAKMANDLMESLEPFDVSRAVDFKTPYLAGYYADKYDVDARESVPRANDRIRATSESTLRGTVVGYTSVRTVSSNVRLTDNKARYALFPVWLLQTSYKGETYHFAMNGQTGKLVGDLPISWGRFFAWWAGLSVGIAGLAMGLTWLFG